MRRFGSVTVSVMLAVGLLAGLPHAAQPAQAATASAPKASQAHPIKGQSFTVSGRLTTKGVRPVVLQRKVGSKWVQVATGQTTSTGAYSFTTSLSVPATKLRVVAMKVTLGKKTYPKIVSKVTSLRTVSVTPAIPIAAETFAVAETLGKSGARPVVLQRKVGTTWVQISSGQTTKSGYFTFSVSLPATSDLRVVAPKAKVGKKKYSQVTGKTFRVIATTQEGTISLPSSGATQQALVATATFTPARAGRVVELQQMVGTTWTTVATGTQDGSGSAVLGLTPTVAGTFTYRAVAVTSQGAAAVATPPASVSVTSGVAALSIVTEAVTAAIVGEQFNAVLLVAGGTAPYTWSAVGLPQGIALSADGKLAGKPTTPGTYTVHLAATDAASRHAETDVQIVVGPSVGISNDDLPTALSGDDYDANLTGTGGTAPYTWAQTGLPAGIALSTDGHLSGITTSVGDHLVNLTITDANNKTATKVVSFTVIASLAITTTTLPDGVVGTVYATTLTAGNGALPYVWSATGLPDGLELSSAGVLSGTPSVAKTYPDAKITVRDANNKTTSTTFSITIKASVTITTTALPRGVVAAAYSTDLAATGGTTPYTWTATGLPEGLTLSEGGVLSGTPATAGSFTVHLSILDGKGATAATDLSLLITDALAISTDVLPGLVSGAAYSAALTGTGGTPDYTWTASGLPDGITLSADGHLSGTTTAVGVHSVQLTLTDANAETATKTVSFTVTAALSITTASLPDGIVGTAYTATLTATGGTPDYTWTASGLPDGLTINETTGTISGTPTTAGSNTSVSITATDAALVTQTRAFSVTVASGGVKAIAAGANHMCALSAVGGVKCWGSNYQQQIGDPAIGNFITRPMAIPGLSSDTAAIAVGSTHNCILTTAGGVKCWGPNGAGQLGNNSTTTSATPVDVTGLTSGVTAITAGNGYSCALTTTGGVKCWGYNSYGQLGNDSTSNSSTPVDVTGLTSGVIAIGAGANHTCAVTEAGAVKCWGFNSYGQLGNNSITTSKTPVDVSGLSSGFSAVTGGTQHSCALTAAGGVTCWGMGVSGQLGNGLATTSQTPVNVSGLSTAASISAKTNHGCAVTATGGAKCWGYNGYGQMGNGTKTSANTPVNVTGLTSGVTAITTGDNHSCALTATGGVKCWGLNSSGQLGDGTTATATTAVDVLGLDG
jgi:alpha-tubulin suppressor-like RCC1 family protein